MGAREARSVAGFGGAAPLRALTRITGRTWRPRDPAMFAAMKPLRGSDIRVTELSMTRERSIRRIDFRSSCFEPASDPRSDSTVRISDPEKVG